MHASLPPMDLDDAISASHRAIPVPLIQKLEWNVCTARFCELVRGFHGAPVKDVVILQRAIQLAHEGILPD